MKLALIIVLALVAGGLAFWLFQTKQQATAQFAADAGVITDFSNQVNAAQAEIVRRDGSLVTLSNALAECSVSAQAISNQLAAVQADNLQQTEKITGLDHQVAQLTTEKQALFQQAAELTNQLTAVQTKLTQTAASLTEVSRQFGLLENRFRRDVAERTVLERRFNMIPELDAQIAKLQLHPGEWPSPESIYAGLGVEVLSNGNVHVISPD